LEESHSQTPIFDEELQIEDDDGLLVENGEQHVLDLMMMSDFDCYEI
jgi:hypothetical protein